MRIIISRGYLNHQKMENNCLLMCSTGFWATSLHTLEAQVGPAVEGLGLRVRDLSAGGL